MADADGIVREALLTKSSRRQDGGRGRRPAPDAILLLLTMRHCHLDVLARGAAA